jgi:hypothetical protein
MKRNRVTIKEQIQFVKNCCGLKKKVPFIFFYIILVILVGGQAGLMSVMISDFKKSLSIAIYQFKTIKHMPMY